jgi:GNAT superfamily N-acetyltransferase
LNLCVHPNAQHFGYGRRLLSALMLRAAEADADKVFLEVRPSNEIALRLYRSAGFEQIGIRPAYYQADHGREDAVILAATLLIFVSSFVACGVEAGEPDVGALSQRDMFEHIRRVCRATTLPVFADADTGYGGMLDVQRTIRLWEEAGASCLHLEDQALPKKCGHFAGKQLVSQQEMVYKIKAMTEAR